LFPGSVRFIESTLKIRLQLTPGLRQIKFGLTFPKFCLFDLAARGTPIPDWNVQSRLLPKIRLHAECHCRNTCPTRC
jgi:hypothetical protein